MSDLPPATSPGPPRPPGRPGAAVGGSTVLAPANAVWVAVTGILLFCFVAVALTFFGVLFGAFAGIGEWGTFLGFWIVAGSPALILATVALILVHRRWPRTMGAAVLLLLPGAMTLFVALSIPFIPTPPDLVNQGSPANPAVTWLFFTAFVGLGAALYLWVVIAIAKLIEINRPRRAEEQGTSAR